MHVEPVLTANQQLVFKALGDSGAPSGAYTILERLQGKGIKAPLQVYRALEKLIDFGLVHRLESLNAFVVCDHHGDHTKHPGAFAICDACGLVSEFVDASVQEGLTRWTTGHAFRPKRVTVELRGLCERCDGASE
jgi:Fur family zinc uptake transcriptional regulator